MCVYWGREGAWTSSLVKKVNGHVVHYHTYRRITGIKQSKKYWCLFVVRVDLLYIEMFILFTFYFSLIVPPPLKGSGSPKDGGSFVLSIYKVFLIFRCLTSL